MNIAGLTDSDNCEQAKAVREWQKDQYRIFPKIKLWEKIKHHFKRHEHKWDLIKDQERRLINTWKGKDVGNTTIYLKAYKCRECGEFKFWYSKDMTGYDCLEQTKELFEFNVINEMEGNLI